MSTKTVKEQAAFPLRRLSGRHPGRKIRFPGISPCLRLIILFWGLSLLVGCGGGTGTKYVTAKGLPVQAAPSPNEELQKQLMIQSSQTTLANYKDYKVGPEDLLVIEVYGQEALKRELRVNGQGFITMPLVGPVKVGGLTTQEIEDRLEQQYGENYLRNPQITAVVKEYHHQRVAVTGAVDKPGSYEIIGPRSLLEVLSLAGGFSGKPRAEPGDVIHIIRRQSAANRPGAPKGADSPGKQTVVINLHKLVSGQAPELNLTVESGDVVHVPFAGTAYVLGGVKKPGNVSVKENLTVSQAIAMAGGVDPLLGTQNITVMRFDSQGKPISIETNLKSITTRQDSDIPIQGNDVIVVKEGELKKRLWVIRQILPIPSGGYAIPTQ
jgi:polysaccharide biosynthesis/export protein